MYRAYGLRADDADEDAVLVRDAKAEPEAFDLLYVRYVERVYGYVRARVGSDDDAEDLTQQVFLKALDALPGYRDRGLPFAAWLFRIARNVAIDNSRRRRGDLAWDALPESAHPTDSQDVCAEVSQRDALAHLLSALGEGDRDLVMLHFVSGLTLREIGLVVGQSQAKVQRRLASSVRKLKEQGHER
jgi:RNA polymerase sigma-70 factor (ECF subfamily)